MTAEQQKLAVKYIPLARATAMQMKRAWVYHREELEAAAMLALVQAAQSFDPSYGVNFATFARYRIKGALKDAFYDVVTQNRAWKPSQGQRPFGGWFTKYAERAGLVIDGQPEEQAGNDMEVRDEVEGWIDTLPRSHAKAFRHIYIDGKTQDEAAALMGLSKSRMSRMHSEAICWLRRDHRLELCA